MNTAAFYSAATLNGKFQVLSNQELSGKGIRKYTNDTIHTHKGEIYKDLKGYWVSASALKNIENLVSTSFC